MGRTRLTVVLVAIAGLIAGFILRGFFQPAPAAPLKPIGISDPERTGPPVAGWCCAATGDTCVQSTSALQCLEEGGRGFHKTQDGCNKFCAFLSTQQ